MQKTGISDEYFEGAISVEHGAGWVKPWRLPCDRLDLFPAPGDSLVGAAAHSSGVRLRFRTDSTHVGLTFLPLPIDPLGKEYTFDATVAGELVETATTPQGGQAAMFRKLPGGTKVVEIWLPHDRPIELMDLTVDDGATCEAAPDERSRWVSYGSSLTHCRRAHSPARTWPAIVARRKNLHLTNLGYGGNCCLEPMMGIVIRDLPADFISLKLGINCIGGSLAARTFAAAVTGLVQIIREKQPDTPIALISPIGYPPHETTPNIVNYTIEGMRADIEDVHHRLVKRGDENLYYFNGLDIFTLAEIAAHTDDQCHPDADGIELMAENFLRTVTILP